MGILSAYNRVGNHSVSSASKGCGKPQLADEQKVDTHAFCYVVK